MLATLLIQRKEKNTFENNYYFDQITLKEELGEFKVDLINKNRISFSKEEGFIGDDVLYDDRTDNFNYEGIYRVMLFEGEYSYFKFSKQYFQNNKTVFKKRLNWIKNPPNEPIKTIKLTFHRVEIPFINNGEIKLCTIGDSQTWYNEGQDLRKLLSEKTQGISFVGTRQDTNGFFHCGEGGNNTNQVVKRLKDIPKSDVYSLFIGTNDWKKSNPEKTIKNIKIIIEELQNKENKAKIFITTIPKSNDSLRNEKGRSEVNLKVNKLLFNMKDSLLNENVYIIDLYEETKSMDYNDFLVPDGLHLNRKGYEIYTRIIAEMLDETVFSDQEINK